MHDILIFFLWFYGISLGLLGIIFIGIVFGLVDALHKR